MPNKTRQTVFRYHTFRYHFILLSMLERRNNTSDCTLFCLNYFFKYLLGLKEAGLLPNFSLYFVFPHLKILFKVTFVLLSFLLLIRK